MTLSPHSLDLEVDPQAVRLARRWVGDVFAELGRDDLVDSASLGVSELVTNALLHADPPITVSVRGTRAHPRVEVRDNSHDRPEANPNITEDDSLLSTVGRGIAMVAMFSASWGSEIAADGKTVWFEPTPEPMDELDLTGEVLDLDELMRRRRPGPGDAADTVDMVRIHLLGMPVTLFVEFRQRYADLRRELHLLALAHRDDYPLAAELADVMLRVEQERRLSSGLEDLDRAYAQGRDRTDLEYWVPSTTPETMRRLLDLLGRADAFSEEHRLLTPSPTPLQRRMRIWYLGEFVRQGRGEQPRPWDGPLSHDP